MDVAVTQVQANARKVLILQASIAVVVALVFAVMTGGWQALSALIGGGIGAGSSLLLRRGVLRAAEIAKSDPRKSMLTLYLGAVQRFVLVLGLFVVALALFKFDALATVVGFGCAQLAYAVVVRTSSHPQQRANNRTN